MNFIEYSAATKKAGNYFKTQMEVLAKELEISRPEAQIMLFLYNNEHKDTARDICELMGLSKAYVSKAVEGLLQNEYIEIQVEKNDRRFQHMKLTEKAIEKAKVLREGQIEFFKRILEGIEEKDLQIFFQVCGRIADNAQKL